MTLVALFVYPCFPQVGEIMWYLSSWDWLISHNMRIKKIIHLSEIYISY
jgi:hypothetical protein